MWKELFNINNNKNLVGEWIAYLFPNTLRIGFKNLADLVKLVDYVGIGKFPKRTVVEIITYGARDIIYLEDVNRYCNLHYICYRFYNEKDEDEDTTDYYAESNDDAISHWLEFCKENDLDPDCLMEVEVI